MRTRNWFVYLTWLVVIAIPTIYLISHLFDTQFISNFFGNWAAATLGVILGIPIAIALSRWQQGQQDKRQQEVTQLQKLEHQRKVLELIRLELKANQDELEWSVNNVLEQRLPGFRDTAWKAFSDSGEIQWIDDLDLLNTITTSYLYIRTFIRLDVAQDTVFYANVQYQEPMGSMQGRRIIEGRKMMHDYAKDWIAMAIQGIEKSLSN